MRFFRFAQLHVTDALTGGFRMRGGGQISMESRSAYMKEMEAVIARETLSGNEKARLAGYKLLWRLSKILGKTKIFNTDGLLRQARRRLGMESRARPITFDRVTQRYVMARE
jgi:hypothetical protein